MGLYEEGIQQAREAYKICEQLGDAATQAECLKKLASLLRGDNQLDAAEEAALHAIDLIGENGNQFLLCESHRVLGDIYDDRSEGDKAIYHFETASPIASPPNHTVGLFWIHYRSISGRESSRMRSLTPNTPGPIRETTPTFRPSRRRSWLGFGIGGEDF